MDSKIFVAFGFLLAAATAQATSVWERSPWDTSPVQNDQAQSQNSQASASDPDSFTDPRDNQSYKTITVHGQVWMAENLNYASSHSSCFNQKKSCKKDGQLYQWEAATRSCPPGTKLPSEADWERALESDRFVETLSLSGFRSFNGDFYDMGSTGVYWTSNDDEDYADYAVYFKWSRGDWKREKFYKGQANSVRCIISGQSGSGSNNWN